MGNLELGLGKDLKKTVHLVVFNSLSHAYV
jgi:hypothetical protein